VTGLGLQSFLAVGLVLALVGALALVARRGGFGALTKRGPVSVETAVPLGERRSLVIVSVEGRRLLLGMTPANVSMLLELGAAPAADAQGAQPFEQELKKRT
jgi:flagellar protein FliO/FliZ